MKVVSLANLKKPYKAYSGDAPYVFVSYSHQDAEIVFIELVRLKKLGFNVWYDAGLSPGSRWSDELAERIANCSLFLYFVTPRSAESRNCQDEASYVLEAGNPFLAIHLEKTELPPGMQLQMGPRQAILRFDLEPETYLSKLYEAIVAQAPELAQTIDLRQGFRLGDYRVEPLTGAVTDPDGAAHHVEPKVMDVLVSLAERPNDLVTRDQLLDAVWSGQVAADELLTRAISELRRVLQRDGDTKFIETVPKRGYRLIGDVQVPKSSIFPDVEEIRSVVSPRVKRKWVYAIVGMVGLAISYVVIDIIVIEPRKVVFSETSVSDGTRSGLLLPVRTAIRPIALTSMEGFENEPALSANGTYVAFASRESLRESQTDIYVQESAGGTPVQFTATDEYETYPAWSPNGAQIAFIRSDRSQMDWDTDIIVKPLIGGFETKLVDIGSPAGGLDWSPDGQSLAYMSRESVKHKSRIFLYSMNTGEVIQLGRPADAPNEFAPRFSPDGRSLAFTRQGSTGSGRQLCIEDLEISQSRCITSEEQDWHIWDHDWTPDSRGIVVVVGGPSGGRVLLRVPVAGGDPQLLNFGSDAKFLSIAPYGNRLVYSFEFRDANLWRAQGPSSDEPMNPEKLAGSSTWDEIYPAYSPDGTKLAFISARSSFWELWVADADGSNPRQLTRMGNASWPRWSPDSRQIVFSSLGYPEGADNLVKVHFSPNRYEVYVIDASGGFPRSVSDIGEGASNPSFSTDGSSIYFEGAFNQECIGGPLWKRNLDSGEQTQVADCVIRPLAGPDGRVYFFLGASGGIQSMPAEGGDFRMELNEDERGCVFPVWGWTFWRRNLVFIDCVDKKVRMLDLDTREIHEVADPFNDQTKAGTDLDVSPNGHWIVFSQVDRAGSDLMLVEPFQ